MEIRDPDSGEADFTSTIAIGGNFLSGYQNGALYEHAQKRSVASLIAERLNSVGNESFNQRLFSGNGIGKNSKPWESAFIERSFLGHKENCLGESGLSPLRDTISSVNADLELSKNMGSSDFTLPWSGINDFFLAGETGEVEFFQSDVSISVFDQIRTFDPTFSVIWLGMEDVYNYASAGGRGVQMLTPLEFETKLDSVMQAVSKNGGKGVLANIPDFRVFPFYNLVPYNKAELDSNKADSLNNIYTLSGLDHINFVVGKNAFVVADENHPTGYRQMEQGEYILLNAPLDSMRCYFYGLLLSTIHDRYALLNDEVALIDQTIGMYNVKIWEKAQEYGWPMVDMNTWFDSAESGFRMNGVDLNLEFVSGGIISLDGYHPHERGYAMIANEFIHVINSHYKSSIPTVYCSDCEGVVFP